MKIKSGQTYHIHLCIESYLKRPDKALKGMLKSTKTGETLTPSEVRQFLQNELDKGRTCFSGCDNINDDGSCAGHKNEVAA